MGRIIDRDIELDGNSHKHTLDLLYEYPDGNEHIRVDFFNENGVLKFHDVYLKQMKQDRFDMYLSFIAKTPRLAGIEFAIENPMKIGGGIMAALKSR